MPRSPCLVFEHFEQKRSQTGRRLVLLTTKAERSYLDFAYRPDDVLLFGRESAGVPDKKVTPSRGNAADHPDSGRACVRSTWQWR